MEQVSKVFDQSWLSTNQGWHTAQLLKQSHTEKGIRSLFVQLLPSKHLLLFKTSSRHVLKTSSARLQRNNFSSSKTSWRRLVNTSWRRLDDVLKTSRKTSWRRLGRRKIVTLETSWRDVLKTSWKQTKHLLGISVSNHGLQTNLNQYLTNLYFTNLKRIQNALIRT